MSNNKLLAILFGCMAVVAVTAIIILATTKKSEHELRMEKIQELDAISDVMRKNESDIELLRIKREIDSMSAVIQNS